MIQNKKKQRLRSNGFTDQLPTTWVYNFSKTKLVIFVYKCMVALSPYIP